MVGAIRLYRYLRAPSGRVAYRAPAAKGRYCRELTYLHQEGHRGVASFVFIEQTAYSPQSIYALTPHPPCITHPVLPDDAGDFVRGAVFHAARLLIEAFRDWPGFGDLDIS